MTKTIQGQRRLVERKAQMLERTLATTSGITLLSLDYVQQLAEETKALAEAAEELRIRMAIARDNFQRVGQ
jgi:hypothetical protein